MFRRNVDLLEEALPPARLALNLHLDKQCMHDCATVDRNAKFLTIGGKLDLHHAIWLEHQPILNVLAGLGKTSKYWRGSELQDQLRIGGNTQVKARLMWPVRQLANICKKANTRYGYIQTDKELVVFEFDRRGDGEYDVQFMPIMWSTLGGLTTDLALLCLCLISMYGIF